MDGKSSSLMGRVYNGREGFIVEGQAFSWIGGLRRGRADLIMDDRLHRSWDCLITERVASLWKGRLYHG